MSGVSSRAAPLAALVGDGEFTPITSAQQTLTADDAAGGFSACAMLTVQDGRQPAPGRHRRVDSVDAFFAVVAAGWSGHGHQSGAPALWGDWTTAS